MSKFAYIRVSTRDQNESRQLLAPAPKEVTAEILPEEKREPLPEREILLIDAPLTGAWCAE